jgi:hypothetical protein
MNPIETDVKMVHDNELFKLVASELEIEDPDEKELDKILKANEIKDVDENR